MGAHILAPDMINSQKADENSPYLPPGFRFHPTDEELVVYYLSHKVVNGSFPVQAIAEVDLNKCEPWDLPAKAKMGEKEWYFFSLRDRKYPTGMRTNRATEAGYWKATGKDREVTSTRTGRLIGMKKTLVFYRGRAPKGEKTNWIMHEYRLEGDSTPIMNSSKLSKDEWVVCRIFQKSGGGNPKKVVPMEAGRNVNGDGGGNFVHRALPPLLESPNPNNSVEDSDCFVDSSNLSEGLHSDNMMRSTGSSWGGTKREIVESLDGLDHGKGSFFSSFTDGTLIDLYAAFNGGVAPSSVLKVDSAGHPNLLRPQHRNESSYDALQPSQLVPPRYLTQPLDSRGDMGLLRACKTEPQGEDDDGETQHAPFINRSSLMESWVEGDSANTYGTPTTALPSMANGSAMKGLESRANNTSIYASDPRYNRSLGGAGGPGTFIPDPPTSSVPMSSGELDALWIY